METNKQNIGFFLSFYVTKKPLDLGQIPTMDRACFVPSTVTGSRLEKKRGLHTESATRKRKEENEIKTEPFPGRGRLVWCACDRKYSP